MILFFVAFLISLLRPLYTLKVEKREEDVDEKEEEEEEEEEADDDDDDDNKEILDRAGMPLVFFNSSALFRLFDIVDMV